MILRVETPHCTAVTREGKFWGFPMEQHAALKSAWMNGDAFFEGMDLWDQPITLKLATVVMIIVKTADSLALCRLEDDEEKSRAMLSGDAP